jgi:hypothetical protein
MHVYTQFTSEHSLHSHTNFSACSFLDHVKYDENPSPPAPHPPSSPRGEEECSTTVELHTLITDLIIDSYEVRQHCNTPSTPPEGCSDSVELIFVLIVCSVLSEIWRPDGETNRDVAMQTPDPGSPSTRGHHQGECGGSLISHKQSQTLCLAPPSLCI